MQSLQAIVDDVFSLLPQSGVTFFQDFQQQTLFDQIGFGEIRVIGNERAQIVDKIGKFDGLGGGRGFRAMATVKIFPFDSIPCMSQLTLVSIDTNSATSSPKWLAISSSVVGVSSTVSCNHAAASMVSVCGTLLTIFTTASGCTI